MEQIIEWLKANKEWVFSGVGIAIISAILGIIFRKRSKNGINIAKNGGVISNKARDINTGVQIRGTENRDSE